MVPEYYRLILIGVSQNNLNSDSILHNVHFERRGQSELAAGRIGQREQIINRRYELRQKETFGLNQRAHHVRFIGGGCCLPC